MSNILKNLCSGNWIHTALGRPDRAYVSEFTKTIDHFLDDHPEVKKDQHDGRMIYWEKQVDFSALEKAEADKVPEDGYGFYGPAWVRKQQSDVSSGKGKSS